MFSAVSASVKFSDTAEAYGWVGTGQLIGAAAGSAVAGFLIDGLRSADSSGSGGAFWASAGFALVGLAVAAIFHRAMPDLRGRDASPIPDTDAVPTQPS
jgi:MFS family permease